MPDQKFADDFLASIEKLGEDAVRTKLASKLWETEPARRGLVELWLKSKDDERAAAAEVKRDAREEDKLRIAHEANLIARRAMYAAIIAAIAAAIAAVFAAKAEILRLISG